mgnify:CR=1 FL=1
MSKIISTRVSEDILKELEFIEKVEKSDRATVVRKLLTEGIRVWKEKYALELYRERKVSLWRAARIAGISLWDMMKLISQHKIPLDYTEEELMEDYKAFISEEK